MQLTYIYIQLYIIYIIYIIYIYYISTWSKCKTPGPAHGLRLEDLQFQNDVCLLNKKCANPMVYHNFPH